MWHTVTVEDVLVEFTAQEQAMLRGIQGATEQLPNLLARVINAARGAIRAGGYALDAEGTTPDQLDLEVVAIARWRWLCAFPQMQRLQTKERKDACDAAMARLDRVARQQLAVEPPNPGTCPVGGTWNSENKLIDRLHPIPPPSLQWPTTGTDEHPYANPEGERDD